MIVRCLLLNVLTGRYLVHSTQLSSISSVGGRHNYEVVNNRTDTKSSYLDHIKIGADDDLDADAYEQAFGESSTYIEVNESGEVVYNSTDDQNLDQAYGQSTRTPWFTLSHYIPAGTTLYDIIQGFLFSMLFCFIVSTCYNFLYYWCFVRCGLCPDDRIYRSLLHSQGRKKRRIGIKGRFKKSRHKGPRVEDTNKSGSCCRICCCFRCCYSNSYDGYDGKGYFVPLRADTMYNEDGQENKRVNEHQSQDLECDVDDQSSLSNESELTLEYGECQLDDEYGEGNRTDRLGEKVDIAAQKYFFKENRSQQKFDDTISKKSGKSKASRRSRRSRAFRKKRNGKSSVKSQASSILSSSSGESSFYSDSSSEGDDFEVAEAMLDLKRVEEKVNQNILNDTI